MFRSISAILLSYSRPNNIPKVLEGLLRSRYVSRIIVSNNNPDVELPLLPNDPRIEVLLHATRMPAALRFFMAASMAADAFICVDDDLFLTGHQIDLLLDYLFSDPSIPHGGPWGQRLIHCTKRGYHLKGWYYPDSEVDVLNRAYAFTKEHATRFVTLSELVGCSTAAKAGPWDDVILSHCGAKPPQAHDLGTWSSCPSSNDPQVALWMQPGFPESRLEIFWRLREGYALRR